MAGGPGGALPARTDGRPRLLAVTAFVAVVLLAALWYAGRPPLPELSLPAGMSVVSVKGHCLEGSEHFMCNPAGGPRSTLTVRVEPTTAQAATLLREHLISKGWVPRNASVCMVAKGCVHPVATETPDRIVVDWYPDYDPCGGCAKPAPAPPAGSRPSDGPSS